MTNHLFSTALTVGAGCAFSLEPPPCPAAEAALRRLTAGNASYLAHEHNTAKLTDLIRLHTAQEGQHPYAVVVCCADSRVPPEHIFQAGIGELFVIRNAGNLVTGSVLASVEYAVCHLHVPLVLILGHRGCGAVASALTHHGEGASEEAALNEWIARVARGIGRVHSPREAELKNLESALAGLGESPALRKLTAEGKLGVAGGMYELRTGSVTLLREQI